MKKLTVNEAAEQLGITKEAIYNRIRRGSIKSITQNGEKYIVLEESQNNKKITNKQEKIFTQKEDIELKKNNDDRYVNLLITQLDELKKTNNELNKDKDRLIKEKEDLLIEQKNIIERVYKEKDEQLKAILTLANRALLANPNSIDNKAIEAKFETAIEESENNSKESDWHRLKTILKEKGYSRKKKKKIIEHARECIGIDENIIEDGGDIYIKNEKIFKSL